MRKNFLRIIIGALFGIGILTFLLFLIERTPLIYAAYIWSIFALIVFAVSLGFWAAGNQTGYIVNAVFPMMIKNYLLVTAGIAVFAVLMQMCNIFSLSYVWFSLIEFIVLAFFAWKILAVDAARDAIITAEKRVKIQTVSWKMVVLDITAIAGRAAAADQEVVKRAADAVRYADPVEDDAVANEVNAVKDQIDALKAALESGKSAEIPQICTQIERLVQERGNKLMILK